jgi:hypothetical protein
MTPAPTASRAQGHGARIPKQFRRVNGHLRLAALDQTVPAVTPAKEDAA